MGKTLKLDSSSNSIVKKVDEFLNKRMETPQLITLVAIASVFALIELINALAKGKMNVVASSLWMLSFAICLIFFLVKCTRQVIYDIKNKNYFIPAGFAIIMVGLFYLMFTNSYSDFSYESTLQLAPTMDAFKTTGLNYLGNAYLEYPIRQYYINAFPSLILGRSILAVHLGYGIPFVVGLAMLLNEIRAWLRLYKVDEKLSLILIYAIMAFPFVDEFYVMFEQAITPITYTMMMVALCLKMLRKPTFASSFAQLWVGGMLAFTYTPTLATLGLYLVFLLYVIVLSFMNKKMSDEVATNPKWKYIGLCFTEFAYSLLFLVCSLIPGRHDRFDSVGEDKKWADMIKESTPFVKQYFTDQNIVFFGIFAGIVLLYMLLAVTFRLKIWDIGLTVWAVAVAYSSKLLSGYRDTYEVELLGHRTMIIIPVLMTSIFIWFIKLMRDNELKFKTDILIVLLGGMLFAGCYNVTQPHRAFDYVNHIHEYKYGLDYATDVVSYHHIKPEDEFVIVFHTDSLLMSNLGDYARYLWPNAHVYVSDFYSQPYIEPEHEGLPRIVFTNNEDVCNLYDVKFSQRDYNDPRYVEYENQGVSRWYIKYFETTCAGYN